MRYGKIETSSGNSDDWNNTIEEIQDMNFGICQGRLTLESGVPITTTDQLAKLLFISHHTMVIRLLFMMVWQIGVVTLLQN